MAFGKKIGVNGLLYRGGTPMGVWLLHRISGLSMIIFISLHVLASFIMHVMNTGSKLGIQINTIYESRPFQVYIYFCVIFHAVNGLRIILLDFWPQYLKYQREAIWLEWALFIPIYGLSLYFMALR